MRRVDFGLYLITDRHQTSGRALTEVLKSALDGGVRAIQLREKDLSSKELYELAREVRKLTEPYGAKLIVNDRIDVALAVGADGVHLGNASIPLPEAREIMGPERLIGVSCHDLTDVVAAEGGGADFVTFGPVYETPSKVIYGKPVGLDALQSATEISRIPVFGLGGVKTDRVAEVMARGPFGVAVISAIIAADDPRRETEEFLRLVETSRPTAP